MLEVLVFQVESQNSGVVIESEVVIAAFDSLYLIGGEFWQSVKV